MDEHTTKPADTQRVSPIDLLYITRAYNRKEISFAEWLRLTKEWAEAVISCDRPTEGLTPPHTPAVPD